MAHLKIQHSTMAVHTVHNSTLHTPFFDNGLFKNYTVRNSTATDWFFDDGFFWRYKLCIIAHLKIQSSTMAYRRYIFLQSPVYTLQESWYFVHNSASKDMFYNNTFNMFNLRYLLCIIVHLKMHSSTMAYRRYTLCIIIIMVYMKIYIF